MTHEIELYVDAKASNNGHFAVCDRKGELLFHGKIFDEWLSYGSSNEQSACECAAARQAIRFAADAAKAAGLKSIRLKLNVDAQWLCSLSGKAAILATDARRLNVDLQVNWIAGSANPADKFTTISGYVAPQTVPNMGQIATQIEQPVIEPANV